MILIQKYYKVMNMRPLQE